MAADGAPTRRGRGKRAGRDPKGRGTESAGQPRKGEGGTGAGGRGRGRRHRPPGQAPVTDPQEPKGQEKERRTSERRSTSQTEQDPREPTQGAEGEGRAQLARPGDRGERAKQEDTKRTRRAESPVPTWEGRGERGAGLQGSPPTRGSHPPPCPPIFGHVGKPRHAAAIEQGACQYARMLYFLGGRAGGERPRVFSQAPTRQGRQLGKLGPQLARL